MAVGQVFGTRRTHDSTQSKITTAVGANNTCFWEDSS